MAELWDIYDKDRNLTGKMIERGSKLSDDEYHIVIQAWVINSDKEWLISQRSPNKRHPLKWEPTGGAVTAGEDSLTAAIREVYEELGVTVEKENAVLYRTYRWDRPNWSNPGFLDVWVFTTEQKKDVPLVLQESETVDAMWASVEKIREMCETQEFIDTKTYPYFDDLFKDYCGK